MRKLFLFPFFITCFVIPSSGQLARNSQEVWPAIDAYYRVNPKFRVYGTVGLTKLDSSNYSDGALGIFVDYFTSPVLKLGRTGHSDSLPGKFFWLRGGYQYSATPPSSKDPFKENMIVTEANSRFYLPLGTLMTVRNRFDWRVKNGDFNARYRPKINIEKDLHTDYLFFTASAFVEYFINFGDPSVNRLKTQVSVELRVTKIINYEVLWNHQFAHAPEISENDAFGMTLKFYLDKNVFKNSKLFRKKDKTKKETMPKE